MIIVNIVCLNINFRAEILPDEPNQEPEIEDDDAELILEKVEEEMMAEYDEEEDDILHIDDITRIYGKTMVLKIFFINNIK